MKRFSTEMRLFFFGLIISAIVVVGSLSSDKIVNNFFKFHPFDLSKPYYTSISINKGEMYTNSATLKVRFSGRDNIGIVGYFLSEKANAPDATTNGWVHFTSASSVTVNKRYQVQQKKLGKKVPITLYVWFKDAAGNVSGKSSDDISYLL